MSDLYLGLQGYNFIKKESPTQVFSCEDCEIFKNSYFDSYFSKQLIYYIYFEFATSRAMRAMRASVIYMPTCQRCVKISFLRASVPINANLSTWHANVSKTFQFSNWRANEPKNLPHFELFFKINFFSIFEFWNYG